MREISHAGRRRGVVRRGRTTVANLIDDDDEILVRIERPALANVNLFDDLVRAGVPGRNENGVVFGGIERAESRIVERAAADGTAFLQLEITDVLQLIRPVDFLRVVAVIDHCPLPIPLELGGSTPPRVYAALNFCGYANANPS
jgi:hypothetical protein